MTEQRARDAVEHLQAAAVEVIAAMRAFLDIAEEVVRDPAQVAAAVQGLAETAKHAGSMVAASAAAAAAAASTNPAGGDDSGVTRIRVS